MTTLLNGIISVNIEESTPMLITKDRWLDKVYSTSVPTLPCSFYFIEAVSQFLLGMLVTP